MTAELHDEGFRAIADFTYDWETWVGPEGDTLWINPAVERITGFSAQECLALPRYPLDLVHDGDRARLHAALNGAAQGTAGNDLEFRVLHKDGTVRWAAISWQSLFTQEGRRLGYRTSVRDITERKRTEDRLRLALKKAEEADRARATFLASISHELRTPIHNLLGYTELLGHTDLESEQARYVDILKDQGQVLLQMVDDLLEAAARDVRRAPRTRGPLDLVQTVTKTAEAHRPKIEAKGLTLEVHVTPPDTEIVGDAPGLTQILRNLLDNARKYTDEGKISVFAQTVAGPDGMQISLSVEDTGHGMAPSSVDNLRKPFIRSDASHTRKVDGAGLGLAIVDRLLTQLGGHLDIKTTVGQGSCFTVTLPAHPEPVLEAEAIDVSARTVLVVDDQPLGRNLVRDLLLGAGHTVHTADSGHDAIHQCRNHRFDVVLMDLHMPQLDGETAAHLIRAQAHGSDHAPRIVAMTADVFAAAEVEMRGFDGYITKPVRLEVLQKSLHTAAHAVPSSNPGAPAALDLGRLQELRDTRTADGETFLKRFGPPALTQLTQLADTLAQDPHRTEDDVLRRLVHDVKGTAALLGATGLAEQATTVQSRIEAHHRREALAALPPLVAQIRAVVRVLTPMIP